MPAVFDPDEHTADNGIDTHVSVINAPATPTHAAVISTHGTRVRVVDDGSGSESEGGGGGN